MAVSESEMELKQLQLQLSTNCERGRTQERVAKLTTCWEEIRGDFCIEEYVQCNSFLTSVILLFPCANVLLLSCCRRYYRSTIVGTIVGTIVNTIVNTIVLSFPNMGLSLLVLSYSSLYGSSYKRGLAQGCPVKLSLC